MKYRLNVSRGSLRTLAKKCLLLVYYSLRWRWMPWMCSLCTYVSLVDLNSRNAWRWRGRIWVNRSIKVRNFSWLILHLRLTIWIDRWNWILIVQIFLEMFHLGRKYLCLWRENYFTVKISIYRSRMTMIKMMSESWVLLSRSRRRRRSRWKFKWIRLLISRGSKRFKIILFLRT